MADPAIRAQLGEIMSRRTRKSSLAMIDDARAGKFGRYSEIEADIIVDPRIFLSWGSCR
jgi:hypothetical protein